MEEIENIISEILFEKSLDEETAEGFLEFLIDLRKRKIGVSENIKLFKATLAVANRFIKNRELCQKALMFLSFDITHKIGNLNLYSTQLLFILSFTAKEHFEEDAMRIVRRVMEEYPIDDKGCKICEYGSSTLRSLVDGVRGKYKTLPYNDQTILLHPLF